MFLGFLIGLVIRAVILVIITGTILSIIKEITHPNWGRSLWVRLLIALAEGICMPVKRLMVGIGIPTRPVVFSPGITIVLLEVLGRVLNWVF
jgi:uncharacterized protein YggT (Ycf19 family)